MKTVRIGILMFTAFVLILSMNTLTASAAGVSSTIPNTAAYIDNQAHSIAANSELWYRFDSKVKHAPITVTMPNGTNSGLEFNVFTPDQVADWWDEKPIGRGTAQTLHCDSGECASSALSWVGNFDINGTYYVQVVNTTPSAQSFLLTIQGDGVLLGQNTSSSALTRPPATSTSPSPVPSNTGLNMDPNRALMIDDQQHTIPAQSSRWFRFDYTGDRSDITATLLNGTNSGLEFNVFTPQQIADWWSEKPIGRGTSQALSCETGLPAESGSCQSSDLSWVGEFNAGGTYYVEVVNTNLTSMSFVLTIQGDGVRLAQ